MSKIIDEAGNKDLLNKLQELGLSKKEAAVYLALLPRRDTGTSNLIRATGLHGQFVYTALAKLEDLGLAKHVIQGGRKKFSANSPARLMSLIEEKRLAAQSVAKELQSRFAGVHEQDFEVYQGDAAFMAHQIELLTQVPDNTIIDVVGSEAERYEKTFTETGMWTEYKRVWLEKNLGFRYLGTEAQRERLQKREQNERNFTYRILPGLSLGKISIEVRPGNVTFAVYGDTLLDFTLSGKEVADGYRQFFDAVWALAKK